MKKDTPKPLAVISLLVLTCSFAGSGSMNGHGLVAQSAEPGAPDQQLEISQEEISANALQPPEKVMDAAGVRAGMVIGEVGSGKGRYTAYLSRRVGPQGKVYANDIDEKSLAFLRERAKKQGLTNIETISGTTDDPLFPKGQLDMVFMTWVYHHLEHPIALLRNLIPSLKPGGTVVIVDPDSIKNKGGKSPENRSPEQLRQEAGEAGFEVVRIETFLKIDNIYVLKVRGQAEGELSLHTQKLSDRVLLAWVGDSMQTIRVVALSTARGVVVIEANLSRSVDARIRQAIEKEFGRKDVKYLINTHFHHDHTLGNQVYADATIIGQRQMIEGMKGEQIGEGLAKLREKFGSMLQDWSIRLEKAAPDSREFHYFREGVILLRSTIEELQTGFTPTFPSVLFDKSLTLDMGDMTLELYAVGGMHTESDIMVFVPEEGLVAVGDMWPDQMLPYLHKKAPWDLGAILENWGKIVDSGREIKHINFAHSDMKLGVETFQQQYRYLKTLWEGLRELKVKGATLEDAKAKYTIERDFPYFKDKRLKVRDLDIHQNNVEAIWDRIAGPANKQ